jgi:2-oxoglutarate dehydrogenase E2 component (dihydrolipoamide succinyltransferase)
MSEALVAIPMPPMGVSVTEGIVSGWLKAVGDSVAVDEPVCEISTDKVDTEIASPHAGVLAEIVAQVGDTVAVGAPLAMLAADPAAAAAAAGGNGNGARATEAEAERTGEAAAPNAATAMAAAPADGGAGLARVAGPTMNITMSPARMDYAAEVDAVVPVAAGDVPVASPVARRVAAEHGIALQEVAGSGHRRRIRKSDVLAAIEARAAAPAPQPVAAGERGLPRGYEDVAHRIVATSPTRRAIAEHMVMSRRTAAHMTTEVEVDMHRVVAVRAALNARRVAEGLPKLSFLPFVARAACSALPDFPALNATYDGNRLIHWRDVNLSIAVDTDRGLLAPVIRGCDRLTVAGIAERVAELAARARDHALTPEDMRGGTFTLSNPGSAGAVSAMAIINQPQTAILGMPVIVKRPTVITGPGGEDLVAIRPILQLALTFDHRALDGAEATRGAVAIKTRLETWDESAYS